MKDSQLSLVLHCSGLADCDWVNIACQHL